MESDSLPVSNQLQQQQKSLKRTRGRTSWVWNHCTQQKDSSRQTLPLVKCDICQKEIQYISCTTLMICQIRKSNNLTINKIQNLQKIEICTFEIYLCYH